MDKLKRLAEGKSTFSKEFITRSKTKSNQKGPLDSTPERAIDNSRPPKVVKSDSHLSRGDNEEIRTQLFSIPEEVETEDEMPDQDDQIVGAIFSLADFNRTIPEYKGEVVTLRVFIKRCDVFHEMLNDDGKDSFVSALIFKLGGKAFSIYENKAYEEWSALRKDLIDGIQTNKSPPALQNELMQMRQGFGKTVTQFVDALREKLRELDERLMTEYEHKEVRKSFKKEHEKIAIRALKEGLNQPLRDRIVAFESDSLDAVVKKALEEEPFT